MRDVHLVGMHSTAFGKRPTTTFKELTRETYLGVLAHPVGATGISMVYELGLQLRREAGPRQVPDARIALQENGSGVIGLEEAACSVMILERAA